MRHTQPLTAEEQRVDAAMRGMHRSDAQRDMALTCYRLAQRSTRDRVRLLERTADLILGEEVSA